MPITEIMGENSQAMIYRQSLEWLQKVSLNNDQFLDSLVHAFLLKEADIEFLLKQARMEKTCMVREA